MPVPGSLIEEVERWVGRYGVLRIEKDEEGFAMLCPANQSIVLRFCLFSTIALAPSEA